MSRVSVTVALLVITTAFNVHADQPQGAMALNRRHEALIRNSKAKEVLKHMNLTADPCSDFYAYACGNWLTSHPATNPDELLTVQNELELHVNKDLQVMLQEPHIHQDLPSTRKAKDFYKTCVGTQSVSTEQHSFLMAFIKTHGGSSMIPGTNWNVNYNWVHQAAKLRSDYGLDVLIGLDIDTNLHTMRGNSVYLGEPSSTLIPAELCNASITQRADLRDEPYEAIQRRIARNMQTWFSMPESDANRFAGDVVRFEFDLCKQMRKEPMQQAQPPEETINGQPRGAHYRTGQSRLHGNRQYGQYARLQLQQLAAQYGNVIDFKYYVDTVFETSFNEQVYLRSDAYFQQLARVVRAHAKPTIANYITYRAFDVFNFPPDDRLNKRIKYCMELTLRYMPKIVGEMYKVKFQRSETHTEIEQLFDGISRAVDDSFKIDWLEENARRAGRQKLSQFKLRFPIYPNLDLKGLAIEQGNYWHKLDVVMRYNVKQQLNRLYTTETGSSVRTVEAPDVRVQLQPTESEILIGLGMLQPPFYHYYYPQAMKYALVGQRIAAQLVRAFDEEGWHQHSATPMHWDAYTAQGFHNRSNCFRAQYSNYLYNSPEMFRNTSKLREIIADSSALNIAFNAYLAWLDMEPSDNRFKLSRETLPEVNFTNTQLFFIHFAQTRCAAKYDEQPAPDFLPLFRHTSERYDVNGPLGNNAEFAREFGCTLGSEMHPDDKCVIY